MDKKEELSLEEQVQRIRAKRNRHADKYRIRQMLNAAFLIISAIALVLYFCTDNFHFQALVILAVALVIKCVEFFVRFIW